MFEPVENSSFIHVIIIGMRKYTRKIDIEDETLGGNSNEGKNLTSDLPSRNGRGKRGGRRKLLVPFVIILVAGLIGFVFPFIFGKSDDTIAKKSLSYGEDELNTPPVENTEPEPIYEDKEFAVVKTNEVGYLNVREEASTNGAKLGKVDIGDKFEVLAKNSKGDWIRIKLDEPLGGKTEGWVSAEYVNLVTEQVIVSE